MSSYTRALWLNAAVAAQPAGQTAADFDFEAFIASDANQAAVAAERAENAKRPQSITRLSPAAWGGVR